MLTQLKAGYIVWHAACAKLPKTGKYSLGLKVDTLFVDAIEAISIATFVSREEKLPHLKRAIARIDTLKIFLQLLWEMKMLDTKPYGAVSERVAEVGKMLGGWHGQVTKQNSPAGRGREMK